MRITLTQSFNRGKVTFWDYADVIPSIRNNVILSLTACWKRSGKLYLSDIKKIIFPNEVLREILWVVFVPPIYGFVHLSQRHLNISNNKMRWGNAGDRRFEIKIRWFDILPRSLHIQLLNLCVSPLLFSFTFTIPQSQVSKINVLFHAYPLSWPMARYPWTN